MKKPNIIAWDLETTNLNANFGYILCAGWTVIGSGKVHIIRIDQFRDTFKRNCTNDKRVCKDLYQVLSDADAWVTWYGARFDVPFLNSRLLNHGLHPLPPVLHLDGWRAARNHLKLNSNRLATVGEFLGLDDKTPVKGNAWVRAMAGHRPSLNYIVDHCRKDIVVLEQAYYRLRGIIPEHLNRQLLGDIGCPRCGSLKTQSRGHRLAVTRRYNRYSCMDCGGWFRDVKSDGRATVSYRVL